MGARVAARWVRGLLVLAGAAGACGGDDRGAPSASSASSASTGSTAPGGVVEVPLDQPSAIDLLEGRGDHGTFTITIVGGAPAGRAETTATGRYVATAAGLTYTVVDLDLALVRAEVDRLLAMTERFDSLDPMFADAFLSTDSVVTDQLQLGLGDLVLASGALGAAGVLADEPWLAFTAVETGDLEACERALDGLGDPVRRRLLEDVPALGPSWVPDPDRLGGEELASVESACDGLEPLDWTPAELVIGERELRVESEGKTVLTVEVQPGAGEQVAVEEATPAPLLTGMGTFFLAVDRCGELPWLYSNFAAANSYTSPDEGSYIGPGPFGGTPVCAEEVPEPDR